MNSYCPSSRNGYEGINREVVNVESADGKGNVNINSFFRRKYSEFIDLTAVTEIYKIFLAKDLSGE